MKILMINVVCGIKSTGRICIDLAKNLNEQGHTVQIAYGRENVPEEYKKYAVRIGNALDVNINAIQCRLLDNAGFGTKHCTEQFIKWVIKFDPDIIYIHNIHGYYINIEVFFDYLKQCNKQIIWTLHDCWAFTGHCCHFSHIKCDKWKIGCSHCPQKTQYPSSYVVDASRKNYRKKKALFTGVPNMELQVPSKWLKNLVEASFLKEYKCSVVPNTVDDKIFRPVESNIKDKFGIGDKRIILGVASRWYRKGLSDFHRLAELIDSRFIIVLIGLSKKQIKDLPHGIKGYPPINDVKVLVKIYSVADVCVSMSREETFGLTTLEAIKCGTPGIVYRNTASQEVAEKYGGLAVEQNVNAVWEAIQKICPEME